MAEGNHRPDQMAKNGPKTPQALSQCELVKLHSRKELDRDDLPLCRSQPETSILFDRNATRAKSVCQFTPGRALAIWERTTLLHRLENLTTMVSLDLGLSGLNLFGCGANKSRTEFCVFSAATPLDRILERYNASTE